MDDSRPADVRSMSDEQLLAILRQGGPAVGWDPYFAARDERDRRQAEEARRRRKVRKKIDERVRERLRKPICADLTAEEREWLKGSADQCARNGYVCQLTGEPFDCDFEEGEYVDADGKTRGRAGRRHLGPSPDRINSERGYVPGNVQWVCWWVNRAKGQMSNETFLRLLDRYAARQNK